MEELTYVRDRLVVERSRYEEHTWAGASDLQRESHWVWITGGAVNSSFWDPGEPNNGGEVSPVKCRLLTIVLGRREDCAMFHDNKLQDVHCNKKKMVLCKMAAVRNGFLNELDLADHLHNIEKDVINLKINITLLQQQLQDASQEDRR